MFGGKSFAEKTVERKGRDYDDDVLELEHEVRMLRAQTATRDQTIDDLKSLVKSLAI